MITHFSCMAFQYEWKCQDSSKRWQRAVRLRDVTLQRVALSTVTSTQLREMKK
jgi:hypothetical protein